MKRKSFAKAKNYRASNKGFRIWVRFVKKRRHRKARRGNPEIEYKKTGAWEID